MGWTVFGGSGGGGGGGGGSSSSHIKYDKDKNRVVVDRALEITENTLGWGDAHDAYAAGETIAFTNNSSETAFSPPWYGIRNQAVEELQGAGGIVPLSSRVYANLTRSTPAGAPSANVSVPFVYTFTLSHHSGMFHCEMIVEEEVAVDDWVQFEAYYGDSTNGVRMFRAQFTGKAYSPGDTLSEWFGNNGASGDRRVDAYAGQIITIAARIAKGREDAELNPLIVRAAATASTLPYFRVRERRFTEVDVPLGVIFVDEDYTIEHSATYSVDTGAWPVDLIVNENVGFSSFRIFDHAGTFNQNDCTVIIGTDSYVLDKKDKEYQFYRVNGAWHVAESDKEVKHV